jgi:DNA-binding Lrp family transcriptional regulator
MCKIARLFGNFGNLGIFGMKLTRRQEEIIHKMLDLYRELQGPIHYSALADRLGISPFTAYDMLRLLEEKGLVTSEYQLAADKSGPGRTVRLFSPTRQAQELVDLLTIDMGGVEWESAKQRVLDSFRSGDLYDRELADEMLARIPSGGRGQLPYCVEVMTIVAIRIRSIEGRQCLLKYLPEILPESQPAKRTNLCMLGGYALGILSIEDSGDEEWVQLLIEHVQSYMNIIIKMDSEKCRLLGEHLIRVFAPLSESGLKPSQ